jgi:hypothetical protein
MRKTAYILPVLALLAYVPRANAALVINYQIDLNPITLCGTGADAGPVSCSFSAFGVSAAVVTATSNSPGTAGGANQLADTVQVTSTGSHTVMIWVTAQDFTAPTAAPLTYVSNLGITAPGQNTTSMAGLHSCIDTTNGVAPPIGCGGGSLTNVNQSLTGAGSMSNSVTTPVGPIVPTGIIPPCPSGSHCYSLEQAITLTLINGSNFNIITSQSVTPTVPEPTSIVLLGSAILGAIAGIRKKAANRS